MSASPPHLLSVLAVSFDEIYGVVSFVVVINPGVARVLNLLNEPLVDLPDLARDYLLA